MKNTAYRISVIVLTLALLFTFAACGGAAGRDSDYSATKAAPGYNYEAKEGADYYYEEPGYYADDYYEAEPMYTTTAAYTEYAGNNYSANSGIYTEPKSSDLKQYLVYSCSMTIETLQFDESMSSIRALVEQYNGMIEQMDVSDNASNWYYESYMKRSATLSASMVLRIPTPNFNEFLEAMNGQGKVTSQSQNVENITRSYTDTATTIESLKIQEQRLLEMMENASTIEEMLQIEDRLSDVQAELKMYQNRLNGMDTDVAYSTFRVRLTEVLEYTPDTTPVKTSTFGDRLKNTLSESRDNFLGFLEDLLFFLIRAIPVLIVLGAIGYGIFRIIRSIARRKKAKKAAKKAVYAPAEAIIQKDAKAPENPEN